MSTRQFKKVTSLTLLISFVLLMITSIILYIVPHGRIAYWSSWNLWGLSKTEWANLHINIGYLFILFSLIHFFYNWKSIVNYLKNKLKQIKIVTLEFNIAFLIVLITVIGTQFSLPPFSSIIRLGDMIKDSSIKKYGEPPYGHAELSSLEIFSKNIEVDLKVAKKRLKRFGIKFKNEKQSLKEIADLNKITPKNIFEIIKPSKKKKGEILSLPQTANSGIGRIPLKKISAKYNIELKKILTILSENNIQATPEMNLKEIAEKNGTSAFDLYEIVLKGLDVKK